MVNKLILQLFFWCALLSVTISFAFAFVISPSQIDVPVLSNGTNFTIDLVSDAQLSLLKTNCTIVDVVLENNRLTLVTSPFAVSDSQECTVSVNEYEKPSVSFDFTLFVDVRTSLFANMTITYDEKQLVIVNKGTGAGRLWVNIFGRVESCALNPTESCRYTPKGIVVVCEDVDCKKQLFNREFKEDLIADDFKSLKLKRNTKLVLWIIVSLLLFAIILGLYYFTRRNRTLLKNTR